MINDDSKNKVYIMTISILLQSLIVKFQILNVDV